LGDGTRLTEHGIPPHRQALTVIGNNMRLRIVIFILPFLTSFNVKGQNCSKEAANNFIKELFQKGQYRSYDSTQFRGYDRKLKAITTPTLNKLLSDYCFFSTTFLSNDYEYDDVETAVAFSNNKKSFLIHSPVFTRESKEFINLFYGLKTKDTAQSVILAKEIVGIFSNITYLGRINRLINLREKGVISFELWHNDLSWGIYDFYFDTSNALTQIKIKSGVKRQGMIDDYRRQ
jgi:hypothetical protein